MMRNRATPFWKIAGLCVLLASLVWLVFGQTLGHRFVNFDDGTYVYRNPDVTRGITIQGIKWALTHVVAANWHPLTILSHMLDCRLYGIAPAGHHFTNILLHTVSTVLLFLVLWSMTNAVWRSAFVAAVFAIHPLHVESVAWIAERKDVLSAVFFMLTIAAYVYYARRPTLARYGLMSTLFACGLMAKPMLVTLPFVLLLLDYWPLDRFRRSTQTEVISKTSPVDRGRWRRLVLEKIPLLVLSATASVATLFTQHQSINLITKLSLTRQIASAFAALMIYLGQTIWPANLAVFYPHSESGIPVWEVTLSLIGFAVISATAFYFRKTRPYFAIGWLWYVGMLVPVLGIIQVGLQAHADRYTYLPQIGLCLIATWAIADFFRQWRYRQVILSALSLATLAALTWRASIQASYWTDSESLWEHTLAVTSNNETVREHLSDAYLDKGRVDDAIAQAREALNIQPESADAHGTLGAALARKGQSLDEALAHLRAALEVNPNLARVHYNLANVFLQQGEVDKAITNYQKELQIQPNFAEGHNNLASALFRKGKLDEAQVHLRTALELNPNNPEAHNNLGIALSQKGDMREAIAEWNKTLAIQPDNLEAQCNLAWVYATFPDAPIRNGSRALELAQSALRLSGEKNARIWRLNAAAHAELGQFPEAIKAAQNALALAEAEGNSTLVQTLETNIKMFQANAPLRDTSQSSPR